MFVKPVIATSSTSFTYPPTSSNALEPPATFSPAHLGRAETHPLPERAHFGRARCTSTTDTLAIPHSPVP